MIKQQSLNYPQDFCQLFQHFKDMPYSALLDSGKPQQTLGRFDILCAQPSKQVHIYKNKIELLEGSQRQVLDDLNALKQVLRSTISSSPTGEISAGAWLGFADYELGNYLQGDKQNNGNHSLFWAGYYPWAIIQDHQKRSCKIIWQDSFPDEKIQTILQQLQQESTASEFALNTQFSPQTSLSDYQQTFAQIQNDIQQGRYQQVNYAQAFKANYNGHPFAAYKLLRQAVPSHYMAYIHHPDKHILSISPECFLKAQNKTIQSQPIKGTAPRGKTSSEDAKLAQQLKDSAKDQYENHLTVETVKQEFAAFCHPSSIHAKPLFELQSFSNVHHLVSTVNGTLKDNIDIWDAFFDCFPGGSITGAPKQTAMQAIERYEEQARGAYCGSVFYAGDNGYFDSNIAIRTLSCQGEHITAWAGGGITAMSNAEDEYQECFNKIQSFLSVLEKAQQ